MQKPALLILAGFVVGLGIVFLLQPGSRLSGDVGAAGGSTSAERPSAESRIEGASAEEVDANVARETSVSGVSMQARSGQGEAARAPCASESGRNPLDPPFIDRAPDSRAATSREQRLAVDLIVAGFAPERAERINTRFLELRAQAMQTECVAKGAASLPHAGVEAATLRKELGDQDYERFLIARGVPTSVKVTRVVARSPAERAGIQRGDEIFSYDGKRVFNVHELNEFALSGGSSEPVVVDVRRSGENFRIVLPRGPMGIFSGNDPSAGFPR
jgi:hypothetical protein